MYKFCIIFVYLCIKAVVDFNLKYALYYCLYENLHFHQIFFMGVYYEKIYFDYFFITLD